MHHPHPAIPGYETFGRFDRAGSSGFFSDGKAAKQASCEELPSFIMDMLSQAAVVDGDALPGVDS